MYRLDCKVDKSGSQALVPKAGTKLGLWHQRVARLGVGQMKTMALKELITGTDMAETEGKANREPFKPVVKIHSTSFTSAEWCS